MGNPSPRLRRFVPVAALGFAAVAALAFAFGVASNGGSAALAANATTIPGHPDLGSGWRAPMGWHMRGMAGADITIVAIDGSKLSLKTTDGWTRTIDATGATVTKSGQTISLGSLKVGDQIAFREQRQTDGNYKITSIDVVLPTAAGTVTAVGASSVTISQFDGSSKTVQVNGSTVYKQGGKTVSKSAVVVGARIAAEGTVDGSGTFTASTIQVQPAVVTGTVASKTSSTIVVTTSDNKSVTIKASGSTQYRVPGQSSATIANVAVGDRVLAEGTLESDGSLTAASVVAAPNDQPGFGGFGGMGRGPGGMGHGFGKGMGGFPFPGQNGIGPNPAAPSAAPSGSGSGI